MAGFYGTDFPDFQQGGFTEYYGGGDQDFLFGDAAAEGFFGGTGNDGLFGTSAFTTLGSGAPGNPFIADPFGPSGADFLDGGPGQEVMYGLDGDDALFGGDGNDSGLFAVVVGPFVRSGLFGGVGDDYLDGGRGHDLLDGGLGVDRAVGGTGNDAFIVNSGRDLVIEAQGGGIDTVLAQTSYRLRPGVWIEQLTAHNPQGTSDINLIGNEVSQDITGNAGDNVLRGLDGNDRLLGRAGDDSLNGGAKSDRLTGGAGADSFVFGDALGKNNVDSISDFRHADDTLRLDNAIFRRIAPGALDPAAFALGTQAADVDDRILYDRPSGSLYYDVDGSGGLAPVRFAVLLNNAGLLADDFLVI